MAVPMKQKALVAMKTSGKMTVSFVEFIFQWSGYRHIQLVFPDDEPFVFNG
jgi:hypothetical protein